MKRKYIYFIYFSLLMFFSSLKIFAEIPSQLKQYTLENNMEAFIIEDRTSPFIRIEVAVKAGFSHQTQNTNGFFKLYTNILKEKFLEKGLNIELAECFADSSRYIFQCTPSQVDYYLSIISQELFFNYFTNEEIERNLSKLQDEVKENYYSLGGLINSAIDSRVFSSSPWKHDTGVYPPLFSKIQVKSARSILSEISEKYYIPQKSALFLSGNISLENGLSLTEKHFERYNTAINNYGNKNQNNKIERLNQNQNPQRKFVIHHADFSKDLLQLVVQYTSLNMEECEVIANTFNNNYSSFKNSLLNIAELNILGNQYIDIAAAHKKDKSRLIIQSLMQPTEGKSTKECAYSQTDTFMQAIQGCIYNVYQEEFNIALENSLYGIEKTKSSTNTFMENLSSFWAIEEYSSLPQENLELSSTESSPLVESILSKSKSLKNINLQNIQTKLISEEAFVFVIMNSSDYAKVKKQFKENGFQEITSKNACWYLQKDFSQIIKEPFIITNPDGKEVDLKSEEIKFIQDNRNKIQKKTLTNGIPLFLKENKLTNEIALLLSIQGGKLHSAKNNGLEEVMIHLMADNIENQIYQAMSTGLIKRFAEVTYNTDIATSQIIITCDSMDIEEICKCISQAIIYAEIKPAQADKAVSSRQYKKRLENGRDVNQMLDFAISEIFPQSDYEKIFEYKEDILTNTDYQSILNQYPSLLDAKRYSIYLSGNFNDKIESILNNTLGLLSQRSSIEEIKKVSWQAEKKESFYIPITHTFLTDTPAEEAGPMPAILIPTTEFLDPVFYIIEAPFYQDNPKEYALFKAILYYVNFLLEKEINSNKRIKGAKSGCIEPYPQTNAAFLVIEKVNHTKELDAAYKKVISLLKETITEETENKLEKNKSSQGILQNIIDCWINSQNYNLQKNKSQVQVMQSSQEITRNILNPSYYLDEFEYILNATIEDFSKVLSYFQENPTIKIYSKDSKK